MFRRVGVNAQGKMKELIIKYIISGVTSIVAQFSFLSFLVEWFGINEILASVVAFCAAGVINYLMLYYWAFLSKGKHHIVASRFTFVMTVMLGLNTLLFWFLTEPLQMWYIYSQYITSTIVGLVTFAINKNYTFD